MLRSILLFVLVPLFAVLLFSTSTVAIQVDGSSGGHGSTDPAGTGMIVTINGVVNNDMIKSFYGDGSWELTLNGDLIGWGWYFWDEENDKIIYENESGDGGGGQTGEYTWNEADMVWDRTKSSHPNAPQVSLLPPL